MSERQGKGTGIDAAALERVLEVTQRLAAPFELTEMLAQVVDAARSVVHAERGTVFLFDERTNELFSTVATGVGELRFPADRGIAGQCAQTREIVNVPDCYADARFNPEADRKSGYRTRCLLSLPLIGHDDSLVGVLQLLNKADGTFDRNDERLAATLAAQCAVALQRVRMTEQLVVKEKLQRELALARDIQIALLPRTIPQPAGYDIAGFSRPADETGGDTFDVVALDGGEVMLLLGDATGHGIGPALSVTQVRAMLRIALRLGVGLDASFTQINDQLADDLADNRFVTAFLGRLDPARHRITFHSGGQGPLLHFHAASGQCTWLGASTLPMGMMGGRPLKPACTLDLEPGDILGLMTDGIYEYESPQAVQFGEDNVARVFRENVGETMERLTAILIREVETFAAGAPQADDMTVVLVRRSP